MNETLQALVREWRMLARVYLKTGNAREAERGRTFQQCADKLQAVLDAEPVK